jgi:hypothetical protein
MRYSPGEQPSPVFNNPSKSPVQLNTQQKNQIHVFGLFHKTILMIKLIYPYFYILHSNFYIILIGALATLHCTLYICPYFYILHSNFYIIFIGAPAAE